MAPERTDPAGRRAGWPLLLLILALVLPMTGTARAMTFTCLESSRYVHLVKLFGNDQRRMMEALNVAETPPPQACRALYATGGIVAGDAERLASAIIENRGWLDIVYLESGGGSVTPADQAALLVRSFWLNTAVAPAGRLTYPPAEVGVVRDGQADAGIDAYAVSVAQLPAATLTRSHCASACTFLLAAGASRSGTAMVHRCKSIGDTIKDVGENVDGCLIKSMRHLYERMGTGEALIATALATTQAATRPVVIARFAPAVQDALLQRCKVDAAQLDDLAALVDYSRPHDALTRELETADPLRDAAVRLETMRRGVETCVRRIHERDRLASYGKLCARECTVAALMQAIAPAMRELTR